MQAAPLWAAAFAVQPARAAEPRPAASAETAPQREAEARFREGLTRAGKGDFEGARLAFTQAYAVLKSVDVLWNLALSEAKTGRELEAVGHFKDLVKDGRTSEPERAKARKHIEDLYGRVGRIGVEAPAGATVVLDGRVMPQLAPIAEPFDVMPGEHFVEVRLGDRAHRARAVATAGALATVRIEAAELSSVAPERAGATGNTPPVGVELPPPSPGSSDGSGSTGPGPATSGADPRWFVAAGLGGVGLVGLGVGVAFMASASSAAADADKLLPAAPASACRAAPSSGDCGALQAARESEVDRENTARALLIGGGVFVLAGAGVAVWTLASPRASKPMGLVPSVGPGFAGARLSGSF